MSGKNDSVVNMDVETNECTKSNSPSTISTSPIDTFIKRGYELIVEATKHVNALPSGSTRSLYAVYPVFNNVMDIQSKLIISTISEVLKFENIKGNIGRRDNDEKFELLQECNDVMLEKINTNLDEISGIKKNPNTIIGDTDFVVVSVASSSVSQTRPLSGSWNNTKKSDTSRKENQISLLSARNIVRPQINFKVPVDNRSNVPFEPKIKDKPNSLKPLAILPEYDEDGNIESYLHPYEFELDKWEPSAKQLTKVIVQKPKDYEETLLIHVNTESKLQELLSDIKNVSEIAVDVEHHSYRTFQGITCLLQISTRDKDYIVDTLSLREELHILNEVFTNPNIVKVFHGADLDIEWLQRDLSIYVVNLFDTHQAAKRLGLARLSLAYLLKFYCAIDIDKTFQLADWRMRPLPDEFVFYARQDTHYLLYIYDVMRNELLKLGFEKANLLESVYKISKEICKKKYMKPKILPDSHMDLYRKSKRIFDNRQLYALKEIFAWRDRVARQEDESFGYVIPNHMILQIAESLPREMQGILACCNPIPPLVRQNLHVLHQFILKARDQPLFKPIITEQVSNRIATLTTNKDLSSLLYCPHDLSYNTDFRDDLPTLLGENKFTESLETKLFVTDKSLIGVFDARENLEDDKKMKHKMSTVKEIKFISPYARYLAMLPYVEQQRKEELLRQEEINKKKKLCPDKTIENTEEFILKQEAIPNVNDDDDDDEYKLPVRQTGKRIRNNANTQKDEHNTSENPILQDQPKKKKKICHDRSEGENSGKSKDELKSVRSDSCQIVTIKEENLVNTLNSTNDDDQSIVATTSKGLGKKFKKKRSKFRKQLCKSGQSSNVPVPFDYSKVDFKKFKGGSKPTSGNSQTQNEFSAKFKPKGKRNRGNNKKFNKLLSFSNVPVKK